MHIALKELNEETPRSKNNAYFKIKLSCPFRCPYHIFAIITIGVVTKKKLTCNANVEIPQN